MNYLLYLHGFRSAPGSRKVLQLRQALEAKGWQQQLWCEQLAHHPRAAITQIENVIKEHLDDNLTLIGSSLGGYYATWLAEQYQIRTILINPAMNAPELLANWLGDNENIYTGAHFTLTEADLQDLLALRIQKLQHPELFWLLAEEADETLDYRIAANYFQATHCSIFPDGNHSFSRWQQMLPEVLKFCGF